MRIPPSCFRMTSTARYLLVKNCAPQRTLLDSSNWLLDAPQGAYTTARTVNRSHIFDFDFHVKRLAQSMELMVRKEEQQPDASLQKLFDSSSLRPHLMECLQGAAGDLEEMFPDKNEELKVTVLVSWPPHTHPDNGRAIDIMAHFQPLGMRPQQPVRVRIAGSPRSNAVAKDSQWIRDRQELDNLKQMEHLDEIVLKDEETGSLLEGLSSNFFVIDDSNTVVTAGEGVLPGTVRDLVLKVCQKNGIRVVLEPPILSEAGNEPIKWKGALVTSTSRLALPVKEIMWQTSQGDNTTSFDTGPTSLASKIEDMVLSEIENNSQKVFNTVQ